MYKLRYIFVVFFAILGIIAGGIASQMGPLSKAEEMMPPDHPLVIT